MERKKCIVRVGNLALDGPIGSACTYPDGPCLRLTYNLQPDETFDNLCQEELEQPIFDPEES